MLVEKTVRSWLLSDDDKQTIKENAKGLRDFLKIKGYNTYREFYEDYRCSWEHDWYEFYNFIEDYLPFVKEEKPFIIIGNLLVEIDSAIKDLEKSILQINTIKKILQKKYSAQKMIKS